MNKEPAIAATDRRDRDVTASGVRERYLRALAELAEAVAGYRLSAPVLTAIERLNAAYYLDGYLSVAEHTAAVDQAIDDVRNAQRGLQQYAGGSWTRLAALLRRDETSGVRRLLDATERRSGDLHTLIAVQHVLEIMPDLPASVRNGLLASVERYALAAAPSDPAASRGGRTARDRQRLHAEAEQLRCWARQNARPPREGETVAWARCISRREPLPVLTQALASGLAFTVLVDALSIAAAMQATRLPGRESGLLIAAAHAVRRLSDLGGAPATAAWLDVAVRLSGRVELSQSAGYSSGRNARELALAAVRSGVSRHIQVAEAALVESESLPRELSPLMLEALSRLLAINTTSN